jgi:hypothetical protein
MIPEDSCHISNNMEEPMVLIKGDPDLLDLSGAAVSTRNSSESSVHAYYI